MRFIKNKLNLKHNKMSKEPKFKIGDKVEVIDAGLLMLQRFAPKKSEPNNVGKIAEILEDGSILVEFKLSGKDHSQVAPYPADMVRRLNK